MVRSAAQAAQRQGGRGVSRRLIESSFWYRERLMVCAARPNALESFNAYEADLLHMRSILSNLMTQLEWNRRSAALEAAKAEVLSPRRLLYINLWERRFPGCLLLPVLDKYALTMTTDELSELLELCARCYFPHLATFSHELRHDVLLLYGLQLTYSDLIRTMIAVYPRYHNGAYRRMNADEILNNQIARGARRWTTLLFLPFS